ncbi:GLR3.4 [Symbiodinium sp. KB8]|nr:GLR3.4 [Symbiodinium sp. KB8]
MMKPLLLFGWMVDAAARSMLGEPECPCISDTSELIEQLRSELVALGRPSTYGLMGCDVYDANISASDCGSNEEPHCLNPWCFVDMTLCPIHTGKCEAAGGILGSEVSPHCRTRPHSSRPLVNMSAYYSYETCGSVNMYNKSRHSLDVGGHVIRVVVDPVAPWILKRTDIARNQEYGGPSYDFFVRTLDLFEPKPVLRIVPGWATQQSKQKFESDYTACVHDVALGNFDLCIADLWLTPERHLLATFVPPLRQDYFFLVVPRKVERVTMWTRLRSPFLPFTPEAWLGIVVFLCFTSFLLWLMQVCEDDEHSSCNAKLFWSLEELVRVHFNLIHDFLLGQSSIVMHNGAARKLLSAAVSFFILVVLASYTASLASILVIQRQSVGTISNIEEAIDRDIPICAPLALLRTFSSVFPRATFVESPEARNAPRLMYSGACGALIMSQVSIDSMHAGLLREHDCNAVASGSISEEEGRCERDFLGNPRDDCNLMRVGDLLWSVPISFPVGERMAHSMSWAVTYAMTNGLMEEMKKLNREVFPVSHCDVEDERTEEDGLTLEDLSGTILIALSIASFGLLCFLGSIIWNVVRRGLSPRDSEAEEASTSASTDGDKGPTQLKGNQSLAHLEAQPFEDRIVPTELDVAGRMQGVCGCFHSEMR